MQLHRHKRYLNCFNLCNMLNDKTCFNLKEKIKIILFELPEFPRFILLNNLQNIEDSIFCCFDSNSIIFRPIKIIIKINLIQIYDIFSNNNPSSLNNIKDVEDLLMLTIKDLIHGCLCYLGYKNIQAIELSGLYDISIIFISLPIIDYEIRIKENIIYKNDGYLNLKRQLECKKAKILLHGQVLSENNRVDFIQTNECFACYNSKCTNKHQILSTFRGEYTIELNKLYITNTLSTSGEKICNTCRSIMKKIYNNLESKYIINVYRNNFYFTVSIPASELSMIQGSTKEFVFIGHLERNKRGHVFLNSEVVFIKQFNSYETEYLSHTLHKWKIEQTALKLEEYLEKYIAEILFFKKKVTKIDIILVIIGNMYNLIDFDYICSLESDTTQNCDILDTPNSFLEEETSNKHNFLHRTIIFTNDISYAKYILQVICKDIKIEYSIRRLKKSSFIFENCIFLIENEEKLDPMIFSKIDHVFYLDIPEESFHDYNYMGVKAVPISKMRINLDSNMVEAVKSLFLSQRKMFKNEIEPCKLLYTSESIVRSTIALANDFKANPKCFTNIVSQYFNKLMSQKQHETKNLKSFKRF